MLLLGHDQWVKRRVETLTFTDADTTRRQVSFDFSLPENLRIHYLENAGTASGLIGVPLTFLGRGDLIHADVRSASGESLSLANFQENREIGARALDYCFKRISGWNRLLQISYDAFSALRPEDTSTDSDRTKDDDQARKRWKELYQYLDSTHGIFAGGKNEDTEKRKQWKSYIQHLLRMLWSGRLPTDVTDDDGRIGAAMRPSSKDSKDDLAVKTLLGQLHDEAVETVTGGTGSGEALKKTICCCCRRSATTTSAPCSSPKSTCCIGP
ncbi:hypothetical protein [Bifidobacterium catulorum]|nr:hypothetical protein [Bifidobacterium catulorum]